MELVSTPEPHFIPGYTGYCPQYMYRAGKTYGSLTHKLLIDPCVRHSPKLLISSPNEAKLAEDRPTPKEIDLIKTHEREGDAVFAYPIIPGYDGFIPNITSKIGDRFLAAATAGVAEHEEYMQQMKCARRNLVHRNLLQSGEGIFRSSLGERSMQDTTYQLPLIPVRPEAEGIVRKAKDEEERTISYSKDTPPHFMAEDNPEKYMKAGYAGHVPMAFNRFGQSSKAITTSALNEFANNYHHRRSAEWVPMESAGIGRSLPTSDTNVIYHRTTGMIPNYMGHVPGEIFKFGGTFGRNTLNARRWLEEHD